MNNFASKKCVPCENGVSPFSQDQVTKYLSELNKWETDGKKIWKHYAFKNFKDAMIFADKVGEIAEKEGHHPDITVGWGSARIEISTHAIKGLSENDFILAAKIDTI